MVKTTRVENSVKCKLIYLACVASAEFLHNLQHAPGDVVDLGLAALVGVAHAGGDVPRNHRRRHLQNKQPPTQLAIYREQHTRHRRVFAMVCFITCLFNPFVISQRKVRRSVLIKNVTILRL